MLSDAPWPVFPCAVPVPRGAGLCCEEFDVAVAGVHRAMAKVATFLQNIEDDQYEGGCRGGSTTARHRGATI